MSIDITKLSPAPWAFDADASIRELRDANGNEVIWTSLETCHLESARKDDLPLIALSRNWLDIQMRRGWGISPSECVNGQILWELVGGSVNDMLFVVSREDTPLAAMEAAVEHDRILTESGK